jgi:hypothetical protein
MWKIYINKASSAPQLTKGNLSAIEDIQPDKSFIIAPVSSTYSIAEKVRVTHLMNFLKKILNQRNGIINIGMVFVNLSANH